MSYVALATAVVGAGTAAYSAYSSNKAAKTAAAGSAAASGSKYKKLKLPDMPDFIPNNVAGLNQTAVDYDTAGYAASDADFAGRHAPILSAEKLFEAQTLKDQQGESELMPAIQNEFMRAGLQGSLSSFGDSSGTLAPGSAGEASVARNLGMSIVGFQDRNRENRIKSLVTAEQLFPRRKFGLSGADAAGIEMSNTEGLNNWNQGDYANKVQLAQFDATGQANFNNAGIAQKNVSAQAEAMASAERTKALISAAEMAAKLYATNSAQKTSSPYDTGTYSAAKADGWKTNAGGTLYK